MANKLLLKSFTKIRMKKQLGYFLIFSFYLLCLNINCGAQTLQTISVDSLFIGQPYPYNITVTGDSIFPNQYKVYGIYFHHKFIPNSTFAIADSSSYPGFIDLGGVSNSLNSFSVSSSHFVPFSVDTGMYNLILAKCNPGPTQDTVLFDTLFDALYISQPDTIIGGKIYHDTNQNKTFDASDSLISGIRIFCDLFLDNMRYDSLGNYYFPVSYGGHKLISILQNDYVLWSDSTSFTLTTDSLNPNGYDFGYLRGLYDCNPDTVHQLDTVVFDLYAHGILDPSFIQYGFLIDSAGQQILFYDGNNIVQFLDSNHMKLFLVIPSTWHGTYSIFLPYQIISLYYTLNNAFYVLPPLSTDITEGYPYKSISVSPNPFVNSISLDGEVDFLTDNIKIFSTLGSLVFESKARRTIDVSMLSKGTYIFQVFSKTTIKYSHILVKE